MIKQESEEDLWGYAKRLRFARGAIRAAFPDRAPALLRVLDVGCGNGSHLALPLAQDGFQVTGIDTNGPSIEHARALAAETPNAEFRCRRVEEVAASERFDVVILSEVLEHLDDPKALLSAGVARMTASGLLIVTVPNGYGEFEMDSWVFRLLRLQSLVDRLAQDKGKVIGATDNQESGHVQFFTRRRLRKLFAACNLAVVREGAGSLFSGPIAGHLIARSARLVEWNARVTDRLPLLLSSSWYFALRHSSQKDAVPDGAGV